MTTIKIYLQAALLLLSFLSFAQEKAIDTVYIFDKPAPNSKKVQLLQTLTEADLLKNTTNLSEVLRFQSPVFIKENGRGMVSSPSFRGTTAQQTAFIWNGININSVFLGQGDINNLNVLGFDDIQIKSGGGSVIYGSAAIGGTIHLNNELTFNKGLKNVFFAEYGSFQSLNTFLKSSFSSEKLSVKISGNYVESENDYEVPEKNYRNFNGQYHNKNINLGFGYKLNSRNLISWQTEFFDGLQHYPVWSENSVGSKYTSNNFRSLLSWDYHSRKIKNTLRIAYVEDEFGYFENSNKTKSSGGNAKNHIVKNDFNYQFNDQFSGNIILDFQKDIAEGFQSGISEVERNQGAVAGLLRWNPSEKIYFEAGAKKDLIENLQTPVLFSASAKMTVNNWYSVIFNASKNYRIPSFNDLYWKPGGNPDLKAETSHQIEMGNNVKVKNFNFNFTPYYMRIKDMIRWVPISGSIWSPINTDEVESYGLESRLDFEKKFEQNKTKFSVGYIFTHSKDLETGKFLMYVPKHKIYGTANYQFKLMEWYVQGMYNGLTFTTSDEKASDAIQPYFILNSGLNFTILKNYRIGFKVNNVFDQVYETSAFYPLPKRNYSVNLLINF